MGEVAASSNTWSLFAPPQMSTKQYLLSKPVAAPHEQNMVAQQYGKSRKHDNMWISEKWQLASDI